MNTEDDDALRNRVNGMRSRIEVLRRGDSDANRSKRLIAELTAEIRTLRVVRASLKREIKVLETLESK